VSGFEDAANGGETGRATRGATGRATGQASKEKDEEIRNKNETISRLLKDTLKRRKIE
jgi:hypothetical protein